MRKNRIHHILGYFNKYKDDVRASQRLLGNHQSPEFRPPAPCIIDGVKALFDCLNNQLRQESFQLSVHRVYQSVGLAPMHTANTGERIFALYRAEVLIPNQLFEVIFSRIRLKMNLMRDSLMKEMIFL